jgi:outer membrane protein OmpA-like peptidoglycan-associated protein
VIKKVYIAHVVFFFTVYVFGQEQGVVLKINNTASYSTVERSDLRRYDNGTYTGLACREVRSLLTFQKNDRLYKGNVYVLEETRRDMRRSAQAVEAIVPVSFRIEPNGNLQLENDQGFPSLRGFPTFPDEAVAPGAQWTAPGDRAIDPLNTGDPVIVTFLALYEYVGTEMYQNELVHRIKAQYALRYNDDIKVQGSHTVDIIIRVRDSFPVFIRDILDEQFHFSNGKTLRFQGLTLTFGQGTVPLNRKTTITMLENKLVTTPPPIPRTEDSLPEHIPETPLATVAEPEPNLEAVGRDIDVIAVPEGILLRIKELRFIPDMDRLFPEETERLDTIAAALKQISDKTFLVEGHTAAIGGSDGRALSTQRARYIVDELVARGIAANRFIYKGWGGAKPLGNNNTSEGRNKNRRVEITILD